MRFSLETFTGRVEITGAALQPNPVILRLGDQAFLDLPDGMKVLIKTLDVDEHWPTARLNKLAAYLQTLGIENSREVGLNVLRLLNDHPLAPDVS